MNPFNNRWVALFVVVGVLLIVAELVGTGENGGVLSRTAHSMSASEQSDFATSESLTETHSDTSVVIDEVPEEDLPQIVFEDQVEDDDGFMGEDLSESEMATESFDEDF